MCSWRLLNFNYGALHVYRTFRIGKPSLTEKRKHTAREFGVRAWVDTFTIWPSCRLLLEYNANCIFSGFTNKMKKSPKKMKEKRSLTDVYIWWRARDCSFILVNHFINKMRKKDDEFDKIGRRKLSCIGENSLASSESRRRQGGGRVLLELIYTDAMRRV